MTDLGFNPNNKFIDPEKVLFAAGLSAGLTLADLGAGSGFYTFAAGKIVGEQGKVIAVDVMESALEHIASEARIKNLRNIRSIRVDLEQANSLAAIDAGSVDFVLFGNTLHQIKDKAGLMAQAYRLLKTGGKLIVLEWNDQPSPIGPMSSDRIGSTETIQLANKASLKQAGVLQTDPYHYGLIFIK